MSHTNSYIIAGGAEGKERLNVLARILEESTKKLIQSHGNLKGKSFLDVGCGGGHVALMTAALVGKQGRVTAIDFDETIIGLARADAAQSGVKHVTFHSMSAYDLEQKHQYDIAYSRFLLSHLTQPEIVLHAMAAAVKPGGAVIIEDIDFSGHYCYPQRRSFSAYVNLFTKAANNNGHNANIGLSLYKMMKDVGLNKVTFNVIQPAFLSGEGKWMAFYTLDKIRRTVVAQKIATEAEVNELLEDLQRFTEDKDSIISMPRIFQVVGYRE
ncbi:MAG TPA: methyltransferase domain-containing protein [Flavipsychrobacter sp.]|nr:methyltransferase domain-containing protein [Flavipsychrobacter sp.]